MDRQPHSSAREMIVAQAIGEVVSELRMVDLADYVAYIRLEQFGSLADIVDSAAERFFMPGTVRLGHGGEADVDWDGPPQIKLDMELRPTGATVYFTLGLSAGSASVDVSYIAFARADTDPERNIAFLADTLERARIRRTQPAL